MTLSRENLTKHIVSQLNELAANLKTRSAAGLTDANHILETIARRFLNTLFGWNLINLNVLRANYPAADLGDSQRRIAIQVTNQDGSDKITHTAAKADVHKLGKDFDRLIIFFLLPKKPRLPKRFTQPPKGPKIEIWDIASLLNRMQDIDSLKALARADEVLEEEMGNICASSKSKNAAAKLEMEIIPPMGFDALTSKRTYRLKIKNTHSSKIVKNLKVWISDIEWPKSIEEPLLWGKIVFPYQLPEKGSENTSQSHGLAGNTWKEFDLMFVDRHKVFGKRMINLAPFRPKNVGAPSQFKWVTTDTSFTVDILPRDNSKLLFTFKVTGGDGEIDTITESHALNVPLLLPESNVEDQVANVNALSGNFDKYLPVFEKIINADSFKPNNRIPE